MIFGDHTAGLVDLVEHPGGATYMLAVAGGNADGAVGLCGHGGVSLPGEFDLYLVVGGNAEHRH